MAKFVVAGKAGCSSYAHAELLADTLAARLPSFKVTKVVISGDDWQRWTLEECEGRGWSHEESPLIWRELVDTGGKAQYLGGLKQFEEYATKYYNISAPTSPQLENKIAEENLQTYEQQILDQQQRVCEPPIRICLTNAASPLCYHLAFHLATGVLGSNQKVAIHLYNSQPSSACEGLAMELQDLGSPLLEYVTYTTSMEDAFDSVDMLYVLDYAYTPQSLEKENSTPLNLDKEISMDNTPQNVEKDNSTDSAPQNPVDEGNATDPPVDEGNATDPPVDEGNATDPPVDEGNATDPPVDEGNATDSAPQNVPENIAAATLFRDYAKSLEEVADKDVHVVVSGCYGNVGATIMAASVTSLPPSSFVAAPCLAESQARALIGNRLHLNSSNIQQVVVWGKTHGSVLADLTFVRVSHFPGAVTGPDPFDLPLTRCEFDLDWLVEEFPRLMLLRHSRLEGYREEGAIMAEALGLARVGQHWVLGHDQWESVGVVSEGNMYDIPSGMACSVPCMCKDGKWQVIPDLKLSQHVMDHLASHVQELESELDIVKSALGIAKIESDSNST